MSSIDIWTTVKLEPTDCSFTIDLRNLDCTLSIPLSDAVPKLQDIDLSGFTDTSKATILAIYQSLVDILGINDIR